MVALGALHRKEGGLDACFLASSLLFSLSPRPLPVFWLTGMVSAMAKTVAEKLRMTHLENSSDEELRKQLQEASEEGDLDNGVEELTNPKLQEKYSFHFSFKDDRGQPWEGDFTNEILDITARGQAAVLESSLNGGVPYESMPRLMASIHHAIAHMTFSLTKRPAWAKSLRKLKDTNIIFALFEEVAEHEATFHGRNKDQAEGEKGSE